jgi:hypothetical protein
LENPITPSFAPSKDLCAFYRHGVDVSRRVKPAIPPRDAFGVAIAHELEFELLLNEP